MDKLLAIGFESGEGHQVYEEIPYFCCDLSATWGQWFQALSLFYEVHFYGYAMYEELLGLDLGQFVAVFGDKTMFESVIWDRICDSSLPVFFYECNNVPMETRPRFSARNLSRVQCTITCYYGFIYSEVLGVPTYRVGWPYPVRRLVARDVIPYDPMRALILRNFEWSDDRPIMNLLFLESLGFDTTIIAHSHLDDVRSRLLDFGLRTYVEPFCFDDDFNRLVAKHSLVFKVSPYWGTGRLIPVALANGVPCITNNEGLQQVLSPELMVDGFWDARLILSELSCGLLPSDTFDRVVQNCDIPMVGAKLHEIFSNFI